MWFGWGMFMGPLFLVGLAILIYYLVNSSKNEHHTQSHTPYQSNKGAVDILKERYARGEITKEQFNEMKKELEY